MSRKLSRLVLVAAVATGFGLVPMLGAEAGQRRGVDVYLMPVGFDSGTDTPHQSQVEMGDTVVWYIKDGSHTITPAIPKTWDGEDSKTVEPGEEYAVDFPKAGKFAYYCEIHGSTDGKGNVDGMSGLIVVRDPLAPAPTTTTTAAPTTTTTAAPTTTTRPVTPTTAPSGVGAGVHTPSTAAPAPTTTTGAKDKNKGKKSKGDETTTTTTAPPPPPPAPIDLPDSAIIPSLPGSEVPASVQEGVVDEGLGETPEGQAVALLKSEKRRGGGGMKLLIASGIGLGALGLGTAGYKFANRSSKYFPA